MKDIRYGDPIEVWTWTGWERFDWGLYETPEDACDALETFSRIRRAN